MTNDLSDWTKTVELTVDTQVKNEYWLAKHGTRIVNDHLVTGVSYTLYTVPSGKVLYILLAGLLTWRYSNDGESHLYEANVNYRQILLDYVCTAYPHSRVVSKVFYRATATEDIIVKADSGVRAWGWFNGYIIDEEDE